MQVSFPMLHILICILLYSKGQDSAHRSWRSLFLHCHAAIVTEQTVHCLYDTFGSGKACMSNIFTIWRWAQQGGTPTSLSISWVFLELWCLVPVCSLVFSLWNMLRHKHSLAYIRHVVSATCVSTYVCDHFIMWWLIYIIYIIYHDTYINACTYSAFGRSTLRSDQGGHDAHTHSRAPHPGWRPQCVPTIRLHWGMYKNLSLSCTNLQTWLHWSMYKRSNLSAWAMYIRLNLGTSTCPLC